MSILLDIIMKFIVSMIIIIGSVIILLFIYALLTYRNDDYEDALEEMEKEDDENEKYNSK